MLISESWIRQWVSPKIDVETLAEKLTLAGSEVESIHTAGPVLSNACIIVGLIVKTEPHPNADKLQVCVVDIGRKKPLSIICGAPNARSGLRTAVAINGAKLPGLTVGNREIRGVSSSGMLCSSLELGLDESSDGIIEFDQDAPIGMGVSEYLNLNDNVIELVLTPNRGDCLGISGIAREISTLTGAKLISPAIKKHRAKIKAELKVTLKAHGACPRYVGRAIKSINMSAKTPDWMVERLRRCGMRSINPIVDITNYVMHEIGQPMHAFDLSKIEGGIRVRMAKKGETHKLLDGRTVTLGPENLVIADHKKIIALAGIMGGDNSAISNSTSDIYLEAAFFAPDYIIGKARDFSMHTDASHRFERGVDYNLQLKAIDRATELLLSIAGGKPGPITHAVEKDALPFQKVINFEQTEINRILGMKIPGKKVSRILEDLGMSVRRVKKGWRVKPPSWRFDVREQYDLVEEVGRCYGFEHVIPKIPASTQLLGKHIERTVTPYSIKRLLMNLGYHEAITYSFVDPIYHNALVGNITGNGCPIRLMNPIADSMSVMRQSLWPGLLEALQTNLNRQESRARLFEIGHVFKKAKNTRKSQEENKLAGLIAGSKMPKQWAADDQSVDFFDLKGDLESVFGLTGMIEKCSFRQGCHTALHPGQCAEIYWEEKKIGYMGKLHPSHMKRYDFDMDIYLFEFNIAPILESKIPEFQEISKYPAVQRDLAILVNQDISVSQVLKIMRQSAGELLTRLELFDIYQGKNVENGKKSLAFSLTFQSESSNLTSSTVDNLINKIIGLLEDKLKAQLRI